MYGVGTATERGADNLVDVQVTLLRLCGAYAISLVSVHHVPRGAVGLGEHGYCTQTHLAARTHHAHRDFATIGD